MVEVWVRFFLGGVLLVGEGGGGCCWGSSLIYSIIIRVAVDDVYFCLYNILLRTQIILVPNLSFDLFLNRSLESRRFLPDSSPGMRSYIII